jgi:peroxiredoxin
VCKVELGQLEQQHAEFARRHIQIVVVSNDDQPTAQQTQADYPHLVVVADADQALAKTAQVLHPGAGPTQDDTNAPTTFLLDGDGTVRWVYRPDRYLTRQSAAELLAAIDQTWPQ